MQLFYPPKIHPVALLLARLVLPWRLRYVDRVAAIEIDDASRARITAMAGQRAMLCPNHSYQADAVVMFQAMTRLRQSWHYLSALENLLAPVQGALLRNVGVYSIIRGALDGPSFRCTRQLLAAGERPIVVFPEGELVGQNDVIGEFQPGVAQFAFWALDDMHAADPPTIYALPIAIKYLQMRPIQPEIRRRMARCERRLNLDGEPPADLYDRLGRIGEAMLALAEREYGLRQDIAEVFYNRVQVTKRAILTRVAREVGVTLRPERSLLDHVRTLFNAVDRLVREDPSPVRYGHKLQQERRRHAQSLYTDLWRVLRFAATFDGYARETMTLERMAEFVNRIEWEIFDVNRVIGPQRVMLRAAEPINLTDYYHAYRTDKRTALADATARLANAVSNMLEEMNALATPLYANTPTNIL